MKKINEIDIKVESRITITFGTDNGETFKFFFTTVDKRVAERFIPNLKDYLSSVDYDVSGLSQLAEVEIQGPRCPKCAERIRGTVCGCGYDVKSEVLLNLHEAANGKG